jgi:hypothetical protein
MKVDVTLVYEKAGDKNFSCFVEEEFEKFGLTGFGTTAKQAEDDLFVAKNEIEEELAKKGDKMPEIVVKGRKFDVGSFFDYYPINITQFAKFAGINASQLRQYVSNQRNASKKKEMQIMDAVRSLGKIFVNEGCAIGID